MFLDMCFLTFIAYHYKYIDVAPKNIRKVSVLTVNETNNSITEMPNQEPRNRKISVVPARMEDFVTANQEPRKTSTTTETIELN